MKVKKLIPLSTLIVDTKNGHIQLSSDEVNMDISGIEFKKRVYTKFSNISITGNSEGIIKKSTGTNSPELTNFMTNIYNLIHVELKNNSKITDKNKFLNSIIDNSKDVIEKYR